MLKIPLIVMFILMNFKIHLCRFLLLYCCSAHVVLLLSTCRVRVKHYWCCVLNTLRNITKSLLLS